MTRWSAMAATAATATRRSSCASPRATAARARAAARTRPRATRVAPSRWHFCRPRPPRRRCWRRPSTS
eukprot:538126-Pyramimonas_sp.AAC.1